MSNYSELYQRPSIWISSLVPNRIHPFATILFHILSFINDSQCGLLHLEKVSNPQKNCMIMKDSIMNKKHISQTGKRYAILDKYNYDIKT